ncbi:MAG: hypothetical protein KF893_21915 [Caldilineaceae bacterium]|nr:hypothetical protein [Caldilineaceae bacterium]
MNVPQLFAIAAAVVIASLMIFQLLLALGLPLGAAAWGGQHRVLPTNLRLGSLAAIAILGFCAWVILARADLIAPGADPLWVRVVAWIFVAYLALNTLGNLASKSRLERNIMTPTAVFVLIAFVMVALG